VGPPVVPAVLCSSSRQERAIDASVAAVILAGGSSTRLGSGQNKVYAALGNRTVLECSLATCTTVAAIVTIVVVAREDEHDLARGLAGRAAPGHTVRLATGGTTRLLSELAGLDVIRRDIVAGEVDVVVIHDGARPFATSGMFRDVVASAEAVGGGVPGIATQEPTFVVDDGRVTRLQPDAVVAVQTPQAYRAAPLLAAYDRAAEAGFDAVDTAQTIERYGDLEVALVPGDERNLKITFEADLARARAMAPRWATGNWE
jgi:2-C-methyl-D-erythritol 4-phosphate cytidylyltransferase